MFAKIASLLVFSTALCNAFIVNLNVTRHVDLTKPVAVIWCEIIFENRGQNPIDTYQFSLDPQIDSFHAGFFTKNTKKLSYIKKYDEKKGCYLLDIKLSKALNRMEEMKIYGEIYYFNVIEPIPKRKPFFKPQLMKFVANSHFYSPYLTEFSQTLYAQSNIPIEQISLPHPEFLFFNYKKEKPFSLNYTDIVFKNNNLLLHASFLERIIVVSHYGHVTFTDKVKLKSIGSSILGSLELGQSYHKNAKYWLTTHLPALAYQIKLFDEIGYIYTIKSDFSDTEYGIEIKYQHRYPLLANWKTAYTLEYIAPIYEFLKHNKNGVFQLNVRGIDEIANDVAIDEAHIEIQLPEGSVIKSVKNLPTGLIRQNDTISEGMLTIFGRPTLVLYGKNLVKKHMVEIIVNYEMSPLFMLRVPIMLSTYVYACFLLIIIYIRQDFSLK